MLLYYAQDVAAYVMKYPTVFMQNFRHFFKIVTKFEFSRKVFIPVIKIKFQGNPSRGNCTNSCRQTDITKLGGAVCDNANSNKPRLFWDTCKWHDIHEIFKVCLFPWLNYPAWKFPSILRLVLLLSVACLDLLYVFTFFHKRHDFRKPFLDSKSYFDFLSNCCLKYFLF